MEVKNGKGIRIKHEADGGYVILSKRGSQSSRDSQDTRQVSERKQCSTCKHLQKAMVVKESLFDDVPGTQPVPVGVCTLGIVWKVIIGKPVPDRLNCGRLAMGLKDTYQEARV